MNVEHTPPSTYILRELHDVAVPDSISWMPQTIGWKVVAALLLIGAIYLSYRLALRWWNNRYRGEALAALKAISLEDSHAPNKVFAILKAVLRYIEPGHANLFGHDFLERLEGYLLSSQSRVELGEQTAHIWMRSLESRSIELTKEQKQALIAYSEYWITQHKVAEGNQ
ncbi:DUF4381 domain-containing protein [Vibrio amylolyticus]|uniref:DUF4381 domain-containing protein n=1 Tax=Vibrio amylolyticus TaxID=2847292 RepID=UPI00354AFA48